MMRPLGSWAIASVSIGVFVVTAIVDPVIDPTAFLVVVAFRPRETVSAAVKPGRLGVWLREAGQ